MPRRTAKIFWTALLSLLLLTLLFPLGWMVVTSFSAPGGSGGLAATFLQGKWTLANFRDVFSQKIFLRPLLNSLFVTALITIGNLIFCLSVGYAFARYRFRGKGVLFAAVLGVLMIPQHIVIIPLFLLMQKFGWYDTYFALVIPWLVNPLGVFLLRQYIENLPRDLEDAARLDGAGILRILYTVVAPLCKPALAVLAIQIFLVVWNWFLFPFILTSSETLRTLPVALALYQGYQTIDWPHLMAASTLATLPVVAVFLFFQRQIISGITAGALKQ